MSDFALDDPSFYEDFITEALEHFEQIESNFLALEEAPGDLELLNAIFRSVHTIKGASGFLGLTKVQNLAHIGENVLDDLRKGRMKQTDEVTELLFETTDVLKVLVNDVAVRIHKSGKPEDPDTSDLMVRLEALRSGGSTAAAAAPAQGGAAAIAWPQALTNLSPEGKSAGAKAVAAGKQALAIRFELEPSIYRSHFKPFSVFQMVELVGKLLHSEALLKGPVELHTFQPEEFHFDLVLLIEQAEPLAEVEKTFKPLSTHAQVHFYELGTSKEEVHGAPPVAAGPAAEPAVEAEAEDRRKTGRRNSDEGGKGGAESTIRVSQSKLDHFMNIVAELIISKTMINHLIERLGTSTLPPEAVETTKELAHASVYLDRVSKDIQASVLGIRMVPVKTVFSKFPRMVRDLAKASGKKIELQMIGEDTEIDKSIIEELGDPMIHLIRNSADHGIEMPDVRAGRGKAENGTVVLRARHEGDSVIVEIEDDGKGIDPAIIKGKALEKGLLTQERHDAMTDEEAVDLIFLPGFSTAAKITDISGRGVGMDVVRSNVRKLNGSVSVRSHVGRGSIFTIKLPLTLAIIDALLVRVGQQVFAIPGTAVEETLIIPPSALSHLTRRKAINLRGEVLGVSELKELLHFQSSDPVSEEEGYSIVVITAAGRRMGIIVDDFVRRQEVVIKPLAPYLASLPGISGASILGDGGVVLILDPLELLQLAVQESR
ncbi:MAG: chemotaxis protein CheA [Acidobacteria bacterium]|nr:chemotaxis protein CheA [Acidobacteriota bacterium]